MKNYYVIFILFLLLCIPGLYVAQDSVNVYMLGGSFLEEASQIIELEDGSTILTGTTGSDQSTGTNIYVVRLDEENTCEWNRILGGNHADWGRSVCQAPNGDIIVCGFTGSGDFGGYDAVVYRLDPSGVVIWQRSYGGDDWDFANKIIPHPSGGFMICGMTYSLGNGNGDGYLIHISDAGDVIEEWTYGGLGKDEFMDIDTDGLNFFLSGYTTEMSSSEPHRWLVSLSLSGLIEWSSVNDSPGIQSEHSNSLLLGDLIYTCGNYINEDGHLLGYLIVTHLDDGSEFWHQYEEHAGDFVYHDLAISGDTIFLAGYTNAYGDGGDNGLIGVKGIYGNYLGSLTIGSSFFDFRSILVSNGQFKAGTRVLHPQTEQSVQAALYVYPDLTFEPSSITTWNNESCFTVSVDEMEMMTHDVDHYKVYDLTGRFIGQFKSLSLTEDEVEAAIYMCVAFSKDGQMISSTLQWRQ